MTIQMEAALSDNVRSLDLGHIMSVPRELTPEEVEMVSAGDRGDAAVAGAIAGTTAGAAVGARAGAMLGAEIGIVGGPAGMLIGALIGGGVGLVAGSYIGAAIYDHFH